MKEFKCGLLGERLGHSFSPQIHKELADYSYELFEISAENIPSFLSSDRFDAINVTIPYKKTVMPYLSKITDEALRIGSVNTITRLQDGSLCGDNTDYFGFSHMVEKSRIQIKDRKVLILGSGGASETARTVCTDMGAGDIVIISRNGVNNYTNISKHYDAEVIINTTPVGMYPNNGTAAVNLSEFPCLEGVLDMIYNPSRTKFLLDAQKLNIPNINGLCMLVAQAKRACEIFLNKNIPNKEIDRISTKIENETQNLILIGMPGCGKTTVGMALAEALGRKFIDTDEMITQKLGITIPEIFARHGEDFFRRVEHECICEAGKQSGKIIATGGGVVTRDENYEPLHQNGTIFFINRKIDDLPTDGRPISQTTNLTALYQKRLPLYRRFCDMEVGNDRPLEQTVCEIIKLYNRSKK